MRIGDLVPMVRVLVLVGLISGAGTIALDEFKSSGSYSAATNQTIDDSIAGIGELTSWLELIALIVAIGILITILFRSFQSTGGEGGY